MEDIQKTEENILTELSKTSGEIVEHENIIKKSEKRYDECKKDLSQLVAKRRMALLMLTFLNEPILDVNKKHKNRTVFDLCGSGQTIDYYEKQSQMYQLEIEHNNRITNSIYTRLLDEYKLVIEFRCLITILSDQLLRATKMSNETYDSINDCYGIGSYNVHSNVLSEDDIKKLECLKSKGF